MGSVFHREITVGYEDEGSGEPLMLVHGHPFNRSMWRPQTEHFSRAGWRVIVPDLRGYGDSTVLPGATPLATFARDLVDLLDHLGIERCVLGGLSMGGQIVMECYRLFPERFRGLVLADTFASAETEDGRAGRYAMAERLLREGMAGYAREVLAKMVSPHTIASRPDVAAHVLGMMTTTPPTVRPPHSAAAPSAPTTPSSSRASRCLPWWWSARRTPTPPWGTPSTSMSASRIPG